MPPPGGYGSPPPGGFGGPPPGGYGAPPPGPPPKQGMDGCLKAFLIVAVLCAVLGVGFVACTAFVLDDVADEVDDLTGPADEDDYDIEIEECEGDEFGTFTASGTIKNTAGDNRAFEIDVDFVDGDGTRVANGTAYVDDLDSDETANWSATGFDSGSTGESVECETEVIYYDFDLGIFDE